jgi:hypothetical protein
MQTTKLTSSDNGARRGDAAYVLAPDVLLVPIDDGTARLLDMGGNFHALCDVGAAMLRATLEHGMTAAVSPITARYSADPEAVRCDLEAFVRDLVKRGLLRIRQSLRRPGNALATMVLRPLLGVIHGCLGSLKARAAALLILARLSLRHDCPVDSPGLRAASRSARPGAGEPTTDLLGVPASGPLRGPVRDCR